jgi:amino acid adenylation domain-containing protein/FkbH-like protein
METTEKFLSYLYRSDIKLRVQNGRLRCNAPKGSLTSALQAELVARKEEILAFLQASNEIALSGPPPIRAFSRAGDLPLSFAQQRMWVLDQLLPDNPFYNIPITMRLSGTLNLAALERSLQEIIQRHEVLRTTFIAVNGQAKQQIAPAITLCMPLIDLQALPEIERETEIQRLTDAEARRPFHLSQGPLLRVMVLRLTSEEHLLLFTIHHIVSDGWSGVVFIKELTLLYQAFTVGQPSPLPPLSIQYADFAIWQREWLQGDVLDTQLAYWTEQLRGAPPLLDLPTDYPRPSAQTFRGARSTFRFPLSLSNAVKTFSQHEDVTVFMVLLAAFKIMLARYTGQKDILIGIPIANRNRSEIEQLIGFFANTLVLRTDLKGNPRFLDVLHQIREVTTGAYAHQDLPFELLVEKTHFSRDVSYHPLFQVMFVFQNTPQQEIEIPGLRILPQEVESGTARFDLTVFLEEDDRGFTGSIEYATDLFEADTIEQLSTFYVQVLERCLQSPEIPLTAISLSEPLAAKFTAARRRDHKSTLAITATFTAEPVEESLAFWMHTLHMPSTIEFAPYNQVFQQLLDPSSGLARNEDGINIILVRFEDWQRFSSPEAAPSDLKDSLDRNVQDLISALYAITQHSHTPHIVCICPASPSVVSDALLAPLFDHLEAQIITELAKIRGVHLITSAEFATFYPVATYYDPHGDDLGHLPYTAEYFAVLGTMLARKIAALRHPPAKVIVLDCDQTLWQGICAEDGLSGLTIDPPRRFLQEFMLAQHDSGKLLCLCSKNHEADVLEVFAYHPNMVLRQEHLVAWRVNWHPKSENLKSLARELQLGLESFIFLDDDPVQCAEVQANCPEVLIVQLPSDPADIPHFLQHVWAFDQIAVTAEDTQRTQLYQQNLARERSRADHLTFEAFLAGLELQVDMIPLTPAHLARVAQLTQRTNQFNLTTIRQTEPEIQTLCLSEDKTRNCVIVDVCDRFGVYGLVGVIIFALAPEAIKVDTFLLSCRALGRGVEHHMLAHLGEIAQTHDVEWIELCYIPTQRNQPIYAFLKSIGEQFMHSVEAGYLFRFPAHELATCRERLLGETPEVLSTTPGVLSPSRHSDVIAKKPPKPVVDWSRIARELSEVEQIVTAVQAQKRLRPAQTTAFAAPTNEIEKTLAQIWQESLGIRQVGIDDNFFALGGNSLKAITIISKIHEHFKVQLQLSRFFSTPKIKELTRLIQASKEDIYASIEPAETQRYYPLSAAQRRMYVLYQFDQKSTAYNQPLGILIRGELDRTRLQQGFRQLIQRHESLRTSFETIEGTPIQKIHDEIVFTLEYDNLENEICSFEKIDTIVKDFIRPFHLSNAPLIRAKLLKINGIDQLGTSSVPSDSPTHLLLFDLHHIITDGISMNILIDELSRMYAGKELPSLRIQYKDFAVWQQQRIIEESLDQQEQYWIDQFQGEIPVLNLPTDFPRMAKQNFEGDQLSLTLNSALTEQIQRLAHEHQTTVYMVLLAAYNVLLHKYSGQEDIIVGSPVAGRRHPDLEPIIGMFVNTLALRNFPKRQQQFCEFLQDLTQRVLHAFTYQDYPFEDLVERVAVKRDLSRNPLFDTMFVFQNMSAPEISLPNLHMSRYDIDTGKAKFDLTLFVEELAGEMLVRLEYCSALFQRESMLRLLQHYEQILKEILSCSDKRLDDIQMLSAEEKHRLVYEFNRTTADYPKEKTLSQLFEEQVSRTPHAVAVMCEGQQMTYQTLNERANMLARRLRVLGTSADTLIGIVTERSSELILGILAILKAGGAYVPIDVTYPEERIRYLLEDSKTAIVLTCSDFSGVIPSKKHVLMLDDDTLYSEKSTNLRPVNTPDDLAYVIYTSGSTGQPKGVMVEHRSVVNYISWAAKQYVNGESVNFPLYTSISFDLTVTSIFTPLLTGNALIIYRNNEKQLLIERVVEDPGVGVVKTTPSHLKVLQHKKNPHATVKRFIVGGEDLTRELARDIEKNFPGQIEIYNEYGPTETVVGCMIYQFDATRHVIKTSVPIGVPSDNVQLYILDAQRHLVPIGIPGELYIGGDGVARGYLFRPDLTSERFVPNPYNEGRMYKTGDLARWLPDGNMEFLGRVDDQVKIRGYRIEPGEIEHHLRQHPRIQEVVVVIHEDAQGNKVLCAYYVEQQKAEGGDAFYGVSPLTSSHLREYLARTLPEYMFPSYFIRLEQLPLTPNGKINRKALPAPDEHIIYTGVDYVAPNTAIQKTIAEVWKEVLHREKVGIHENFFDIGGNSLLLIQVNSKLQEQFSIDIPVVTMFQYPTINSLTQYLNQEESISPETERSEFLDSAMNMLGETMKILGR